ncbi:MAG: HU family DNA-binding protein [Zoogloeaceae bacterium]|jgi:DNA-binding protein HU-beta|nr:HU family DNA-binding protein [Zoogloeaceae bacterium]
MNKTELIDAVSSEAKLTKAAAGEALDAFIKVVTQALKKGNKISLVGFGTFQVDKRAARKGRNPRTKEPINIAASNVPKFRPGKTLKDAVNTKRGKK